MKKKKIINNQEVNKAKTQVLNTNKPNKRKHLDLDDRKIIERMLRAKHKQNEIARTIERGRSTISEEIKKGKDKNGIYRAKKAHHRAYTRQYYKKLDCLSVSMNIELQRYVIEKIEKGVSPEDISSELGNEKCNLKYVSNKAIRKFIHKRRPDLEVNLFWNRNNKKSGPKQKKGRYIGDIDRKFIEKREEDFGWLFNLEYGHWEGDFIVSKHNSFVILVLVERSSKLTLIRILSNRKNMFVNEWISSLLKGYKVKSLTLDNDIAA
ncbi:MAG: IS30 family transposase [Patescibacteria group bacterium]